MSRALSKLLAIEVHASLKRLSPSANDEQFGEIRYETWITQSISIRYITTVTCRSSASGFEAVLAAILEGSAPADDPIAYPHYAPQRHSMVMSLR